MAEDHFYESLAFGEGKLLGQALDRPAILGCKDVLMGDVVGNSGRYSKSTKTLGALNPKPQACGPCCSSVVEAARPSQGSHASRTEPNQPGSLLFWIKENKMETTIVFIGVIYWSYILGLHIGVILG